MAGTPERLNLTTLAALCDILAVTPTDLIEITIGSRPGPKAVPTPPPAAVRDLRPRRARIVRDHNN